MILAGIKFNKMTPIKANRKCLNVLAIKQILWPAQSVIFCATNERSTENEHQYHSKNEKHMQVSWERNPTQEHINE